MSGNCYQRKCFKTVNLIINRYIINRISYDLSMVRICKFQSGISQKGEVSFIWTRSGVVFGDPYNVSEAHRISCSIMIKSTGKYVFVKIIIGGGIYYPCCRH